LQHPPLHQRTEIRQYTQGTLGIDAVDVARRQLVWEGFALGRVTERTMGSSGAVLDAETGERGLLRRTSGPAL